MNDVRLFSEVCSEEPDEPQIKGYKPKRFYFIHAVFPFFLHKGPVVIYPWCRKPKFPFSYGSEFGCGVKFHKTVDPDNVTCPYCINEMNKWRKRQMGAPMPMEFMAKDIKY